MSEIPLSDHHRLFRRQWYLSGHRVQLHLLAGVFFEHDRGKTHMFRQAAAFPASDHSLPRRLWLDFEFGSPRDHLYFRADRRLPDAGDLGAG